ncbi:MAG: cytochrome c [Acidimicrobiales bacterium]|nr:cytochrome c [Acidimicrobiales bacterium]
MNMRILGAGMLGLTLSVAACSSDDPAAVPVAPLASDADGAAVYQARCASCHGEDLRGTDRGPSQLSIVYEPNHHGDNAYRFAIRNGASQHHWNFGNMPVIEDITDDQIERVIAYIRDEQERLGFER